jgi:glycosyltransferase involved in cell wall biosynthesis
MNSTHLKVCHLAETDLTGGAARAAFLLHRGLRETGVNSSMLVNRRSSSDFSVSTLRLGMTFEKRLRRRIYDRRWKKKYRSFSDAILRGNDCLLSPATSIFPEWSEQIPINSIVNLHWVAGCIDVPTFFLETASKHRFVWTLHDLWPMTGGCHYSSGCRFYSAQCGSCPQILSHDDRDVTRQVWNEKRLGYASLQSDQMVVVAPSKWIAGEARRSSLLARFDIRVIPYGIDLDSFSPRDVTLARECLGIPEETFVIGFVADSLTTPRKGFEVLYKALDQLQEQKRGSVSLLCVGSGDPNVPQGYSCFHQGRVQSDRLISLVYSAADVFVIPTREDNLPLTVLESLACGTPVIGSDVGGVPDMVRQGETGFLFPSGDYMKLAEILTSLVSQKDILTQMRPACRSLAEMEYSLILQAKRYRSLYEEFAG